jgi:hypothetical protein
MDRDVVEVVARFGATILDVAHVGPTDTYRIGTAATANLTVPGLTCFPLVDRGTIRRPHGIAAVEHADGTDLQIGALTISITRKKLRCARIARPRIDWWPRIFLAASLLAHLSIWLAAASVAPFERLIEKPRPRMRLAAIAEPVEPVEPKPPRKQESAKAAQPSAATRVERPAANEPRAQRSAANETVGRSAAYYTARVAKSFDNIKLVEKLGELKAENQYDEDAENAKGFGGGGGRFDPGPAESIKSGGYAVMAYDVKLCPKKSCTVTGPIPALYVRTHLHAHMDEIYDCYLQHAESPGTIVLEFSITPDGAVRDARGSGLGETGACAARVVGEIYFKALGNDYDPPRSTHVKYPLLFKS